MEIPVSAAFPPSLAVFYPTPPLLTIFTAGDLCSQPSPPRTIKFCWKALQLKSHQPKTNQLWKEQHLLTRHFFPKNILASGLRIKLANKTQECFKPFVAGKSIPTQYIFQMFFIILPRYTPRNLPLHPSSHLLHRESRLSLQTHLLLERIWFILIPCLSNRSSFPHTLICPLLISAQQRDVNVKTGWTSCVCCVCVTPQEKDVEARPYVTAGGAQLHKMMPEIVGCWGRKSARCWEPAAQEGLMPFPSRER